MLSLLKLILNLLSNEPVLPLISSVGPSLNSKKLFLQLSALDDNLIATPKIATFLTKSFPKLQEFALSKSNL